MIVELKGFICPNSIGNKAKSLVDLNRRGFKVPTSVALDTNEYLKSIEKVRDKINLLLKKVNVDNIAIISRQINILLEDISISQETILEVQSFMKDGTRYILRSSIDGVDDKYTYAGLFPTRMDIDKTNIEENVLDSYKALFSYNSLCYMLENNIDYSNVTVAVIIQQEIITNKLGYISTMDPVTLNTNKLSLEIVEDKIHEIYEFNYIKDEFIKEDEYNLITRDRVMETIGMINEIQTIFGRPLEIEVAFTKNDIYILQTRELNSVLYENENSLLKRINMSSKKFVWSLVNDSYKNLVDEFKNYYNVDLSDKYCKLCFNHCYYNVLDIANILNLFVNYDNKYFETSFNLDKSFDHNNKLTTRIKRIFNKKKINEQIDLILEDYKSYTEKLQNKYLEYCNKMGKASAKDIERIWLKLVLEDYKDISYNYMKLKLYEFIERYYLYKIVSKYIKEDYFVHLIDNSQLLSYKIKKEFYRLIKKINDDEDSYRYWFSSSVNKILDNYENDFNDYYHEEFREFIDNYGYLSYHNMDLSVACYVEDVEDVVRDIKKQLANLKPTKNNCKLNRKILSSLEKKVSGKKKEKIFNLINRVQELNNVLSVYEDFYYKFNFIVKRYSKMLAKYYVAKKVLDNESDIWHLDIESIYSYTEGDVDMNVMKRYVSKNKLYYNSYRNFFDIELIGEEKDIIKDYDYIGNGYSTGIVEGNIKAIKSLKDLTTLSDNDILVTKTINNNLLFKLPKIKGIIVSDPYLPNSVKSMVRELRIPCLMIENCSKKLTEGMLVKIDCALGIIKIIKK